MFALVVGGLYTGVFTANEAAAVGAAIAFFFALARGKLRGREAWRVMGETASTTAMLFFIILGAITFSFFLGTTQFADRATDWILAQNLPALGVVAVLVVVYLVLGTAMESATILLITTPIVAPIIHELGYDLVWWGIVMVVVVEAGIISPPYGLNMFIIQSIQPDITLAQVFRGVMPFFYATLAIIVLLILFPALVLWLPSTMMG
jgi:tripartite ATP-independent transporter DctM subunit